MKVLHKCKWTESGPPEYVYLRSFDGGIKQFKYNWWSSGFRSKHRRAIIMIYYEVGSSDTALSADDLKEGMVAALEKMGEKQKVLVIPPDYTRLPSRSGELTEYCWQYLGDKLTDILPALGTHTPMTDEQISHMFGQTPKELFRVHDWRNDVITLGTVPAEFVKEVSEGACDFTWPAQVNKLLVEGDFDLILSIGQVVPHEVVGMANYNKNIFVGTGGTEGIHKSHYIGAAYGMERMMGHADTPVRRIFNYASEHFANHLPIGITLKAQSLSEDTCFFEWAKLPQTGCYVSSAKPVAHPGPVFVGVSVVGICRDIWWQSAFLGQVASAKLIPFCHTLEAEAPSKSTRLFEWAILPKETRYVSRTQPVTPGGPTFVGISLGG